jgi:Ni/Co efflux regulator RcnB
MKRLLLPLIFLIVPLVTAPMLMAQSEADDADRSALLKQRREKLRQKWEERFKAADTDHNRELTLEEAKKGGLPAAILDHFDEIDTDHNGQLSPEELIDSYEKRLDAQKTPNPAKTTP